MISDPDERPDPLTVAIDGPSGSGKSSVSRAVATRLGFDYLDTGAMYRALTWWCRQLGLPLTDTDAVAEQSRSVDLRMGTDPAGPRVHVGETDVGAAIRATEISTLVSQVATNLAVRAELRRRQRALIEASRSAGRGIVVEGRDITTVVAPEAEVRILLSASEEARLRRRAAELYAAADTAAVEATRDQVLRRDRDDSTVSAFLEPAPGVVGIDTSDLTFEQSVAAVAQVVLEHGAAGPPTESAATPTPSTTEPAATPTPSTTEPAPKAGAR